MNIKIEDRGDLTADLQWWPARDVPTDLYMFIIFYIYVMELSCINIFMLP
jgi:hypothetical protein